MAKKTLITSPCNINIMLNTFHLHKDKTNTMLSYILITYLVYWYIQDFVAGQAGCVNQYHYESQ